MRGLLPVFLLLLGGPVLAHWERPVDSGGGELSPAACIACHVEKGAEWGGSIHARAVSPGLVGQLGVFDPQTQRQCLACHAPRQEQQDHWFSTGVAGAEALHGIDCAACHQRGGVVFGPRALAETPHGPVPEQPLFRSAAFCRACHQQAEDSGPNGGPPLVNTWAEWAASPQAAEGQTCQSCHMPEGRHLFRGIHDPDMTRQGLSLSSRRTAEGVEATVTNSGAAHALPTYPTPRITLQITGENGGQADYTLQRRLGQGDDGRLIELFDTRLLPGASATLFLPLEGGEGAHVTVIVAPDADYHDRAFPALLSLLAEDLSPEQTAAIQAAQAAAGQSPYVLYHHAVSQE